MSELLASYYGHCPECGQPSCDGRFTCGHTPKIAYSTPKPEEAASSQKKVKAIYPKAVAVPRCGYWNIYKEFCEPGNFLGGGSDREDAWNDAASRLYAVAQSGPAMPTLPADKKIYSQRDMDVKRFYQDDGCIYEVNSHGTIKGRRPQYVREEDYDAELQRQKDSHKITLDRESATTARYDAKLAALESELQRLQSENAELRAYKAITEGYESEFYGRAIKAESELQRVKEENAVLKAREAPEDAWKRGYDAGRDSNDEEWQPVPEYIAPERSK